MPSPVARLTFEAFMKKVKKALGHDPGDKIEIKWTIGGRTGKSCYSSGDIDDILDAEPEPEFEDFDKVLEAVDPDISYLRYKTVRRAVMVADTYRDEEYYGNYTDYARKRVNLRVLYDALFSRNYRLPTNTP